MMTATKRRSQRYTIAIHEAAHAVIGRVLGFECGEVSVVPDYQEGTAGYAIIAEDPLQAAGRWENAEFERATLAGELPRFRDAEVWYRARAIISMAGAEAEVEFTGSCAGGDGDDRNWVARALEEVAGDAVVMESRLRRRARGLVRRHQGKIAAVADALMDRGVLSPNEINALL
jgi:hypothetical protein